MTPYSSFGGSSRVGPGDSAGPLPPPPSRKGRGVALLVPRRGSDRARGRLSGTSSRPVPWRRGAWRSRLFAVRPACGAACGCCRRPGASWRRPGRYSVGFGRDRGPAGTRLAALRGRGTERRRPARALSFGGILRQQVGDGGHGPLVTEMPGFGRVVGRWGQQQAEVGVDRAGEEIRDVGDGI